MHLEMEKLFTDILCGKKEKSSRCNFAKSRGRRRYGKTGLALKSTFSLERMTENCFSLSTVFHLLTNLWFETLLALLAQSWDEVISHPLTMPAER